jgi:hypothetical protein
VGDAQLRRGPSHKFEALETLYNEFAKLGASEMLPAWRAMAAKVPDLMAEVRCA